MKRTLYAALAMLAAMAPAGAMTLSSGDFADGGTLVATYVSNWCGGKNISPELRWSGAPAGTKSYVLTMIDHSVPPNGWSHWIVADLPPNALSLAHAASWLPAPAHAVKSNSGTTYAGPCPPRGTGVHRYQFTIWAMPGANTALPANAKAYEIEATLQKSARAHAIITGTVAAK